MEMMRFLEKEQENIEALRRVDRVPVVSIITKMRRLADGSEGFEQFFNVDDEGNAFSPEAAEEAAKTFILRCVTDMDFYSSKRHLIAHRYDPPVMASDLFPKQFHNLYSMGVAFDVMMAHSTYTHMWDDFRKLFRDLRLRGYEIAEDMTYIQCLKSSYQFKLTPSQRKLLDLLTQDYLSDVDMTAVHGSEEQDLVEAMVKCGLVNSLHLYLGVTGKELPFRPAMYAWKLPSETLLYIARHHPKIVQKTNPQNEMQSFTACVCYEPLDTDDFELRHKLEALVEAAEHTNIWEQVKTFGNLCDLCRVLAICGSGKTLKALGGWQSQDFSLQVLEIAIYEYYERNEKTSGFTSSKRFHDLERFQSLLKVANSTY